MCRVWQRGIRMPRCCAFEASPKKTPEIFDGLKHHFPHILMAMLNHVEYIGMFPIVIIGQS
jgi:hypothetical protein